MKRLSSVYTEMLDEDVEKYVKDVNSWDYETTIKHYANIPLSAKRLLATAIYAYGWRYNEGTCMYEREENNS